MTWTFKTRGINSIENAAYANVKHECDQHFWWFWLQSMQPFQIDEKNEPRNPKTDISKIKKGSYECMKLIQNV